MKVLLAQINPTVGDIKGNTEKIIQAIKRGKEKRVDLVIFSELVLTGYPPQDFLFLPHFLDSLEEHLNQIIDATYSIAVILGLPRRNPHKKEKPLYNSAALLIDGKLIDYADKILLPTYDVFDERRYFEPGEVVKVWDFCGYKMGITICEDLWQHSGLLQLADYHRDPILELLAYQPTLLINISASPYSLAKFQTRLKVGLAAAKKLNCPLLLCNQVGANDSLIFDGYSYVVDGQSLMTRAAGFREDDLFIDLSTISKQSSIFFSETEDLYQALVMGVKDYFSKLGFKKACLGLSGGIDSALVACIAVEAIGKENVLALYMPSSYSSEESYRDAKQLADTLGISFKEIPIEKPYSCLLDLLHPEFNDDSFDVTQENIQARVRGLILMAFSNKFGSIVLSTGNKSECAMGYSTLYGDMCGGLSVINDITKEQVYQLAHWVNLKGSIIPKYTLERPPSAELRPNQKDSDTLPDYAIVDRVLFGYVEECLCPEEISKRYEIPISIVNDLIKRIHWNEYKRRQSAPGLRVSEKSFSTGRFFPIVQKWIQ